jgi:hypothetical protein
MSQDIMDKLRELKEGWKNYSYDDSNSDYDQWIDHLVNMEQFADEVQEILALLR